MRLASSGVGGVHRVIGCRPKASRTRRTPPTPDEASRMQYSHKTRACHQPWPWPHSPLADERRAARIAVLVGGGRVEVGGWSPEAGRWAVERRVTGAGAGARAAVHRIRKDRVAQLDLLDDDRAHVVRSFMRLAMVLAALADLRCKFLSWRCAR